MTEPKASNIAQQDRDRRPKPVPLDPLGNGTTAFPDGAVHGGEAAKPGQMQGDDDTAPASSGGSATASRRTNPVGNSGA